MRRGSSSVLVVALAVLLFTGCRRSESPSAPGQLLVVFAATSLRDAFTELGVAFRRAHPGVELTFNFAGTQELRTQLEHGASADVFASADQRHVAELERTGGVTGPVLFARGELVLVVATEARERIRALSDLPSAERIVVGAAEVPIGRYTIQALDRAAAMYGADFRARVETRVVSRELNVRQVLAKVKLGEAEAGIVYRSDIQAAQDVVVVALPPEANVLAEYPIAVVAGTSQPELARAWVDFVRSAEAQRVMQAAGFLPVAATGAAP